LALEKEALLEKRILELQNEIANGRNREQKLEKAIATVDAATKEITVSELFCCIFLCSLLTHLILKGNYG
jgi:hypothetical protein